MLVSFLLWGQRAMNKPTVLIILDGFGHGEPTAHNAIFHARAPHLDYYFSHYPHSLLHASGKAVGLPVGCMGNSEVGHITIGAGRVITQDIVRIFDAINDGSLENHPLLEKQFTKLAQSGNALHLMGLVSDAGVHSHIKHLFALLEVAKKYDIKKVYIHAFLDGRDSPPQSAGDYLQAVEDKCKELGIGKIVGIIGRFYAMDRDTNWQRTEHAYNFLTQPMPSKLKNWQEALVAYYQKNITDEFIPATQFDPDSIIKNDDGVLFFNFRSDRARQLTRCFVDADFSLCATKNIVPAFFITMTDYDKNNFTTDVLFTKEPIYHTLKDELQAHNKTIFSIAETEKYAHVTYFFSGGKEKRLANETRILIPSIPAKNYVAYPCMSAEGITQAVIDSLTRDPQDFYLINYANPDMVAHSGDFDATVQAIECIDHEMGKLYDMVIKQMNGTMYITADHGNAEVMFDAQSHQPRTAHTTNLVPFIMIRKDLHDLTTRLPLTQLADIAPYILANMGLPVPEVMKL